MVVLAIWSRRAIGGGWHDLLNALCEDESVSQIGKPRSLALACWEVLGLCVPSHFHELAFFHTTP
jgi:hypothetical protein